MHMASLFSRPRMPSDLALCPATASMTTPEPAALAESNVVSMRIHNPVSVSGPLNGVVLIAPAIEKVKLEFRGMCSTRFEPENVVRDPRFPVKVSELRQLIFTEHIIHVPTSECRGITNDLEIPFSIAFPQDSLLPPSMSSPDDEAKIFYTLRVEVSKRRKGPLLLSKKHTCLQNVQLCPELVKGDVKERDITVDPGNNSQIRVLVPVKLVPSSQPHRIRVLTPEFLVLEDLSISLREVTTLFAQQHSAILGKQTIVAEKDSFVETTSADTGQKSYLVTFHVDHKMVQQTINSPLITRNHLMRLNFKFEISPEGGGVGFIDSTVFDFPILVQGRRLPPPLLNGSRSVLNTRPRPISVASGFELDIVNSQRFDLKRRKTSALSHVSDKRRSRPRSFPESGLLPDTEFPLTPITPDYSNLHTDANISSEARQRQTSTHLKEYELPPSPKSPPRSLNSHHRSSVVSVYSESSWVSFPVANSPLLDYLLPILDWDWRDIVDGIYTTESESDEE
ncbi:hypothetical protein NEOLI_004696 [Neolecta irregularis DAH-3]|uniref:Uncharacterized protein n=1 Tax=Neolecta irregularis (strain DAH-3) TaxID=1198029 RepID=A0A1U7LKU8_NEOID|nr:hypothetical protein NEOLI_004696 [Neolecta irregularis DAH-3]|eukprot:OLL23286.1 hypothetical protein NEOLI_004696 [Neolecta irregularis DAH-3]